MRDVLFFLSKANKLETMRSKNAKNYLWNFLPFDVISIIKK